MIFEKIDDNFFDHYIDSEKAKKSKHQNPKGKLFFFNFLIIFDDKKLIFLDHKHKPNLLGTRNTKCISFYDTTNWNRKHETENTNFSPVIYLKIEATISWHDSDSEIPMTVADANLHAQSDEECIPTPRVWDVGTMLTMQQESTTGFPTKFVSLVGIMDHAIIRKQYP